MLAVDDDPSILELIVTRLEIAGFDTRRARNGQEALQRLTEFRPEAMLLTARNNAEDVAKALRLGARDYLAKPFKDEVLLQRVGRLLARARAAG